VPGEREKNGRENKVRKRLFLPCKNVDGRDEIVEKRKVKGKGRKQKKKPKNSGEKEGR